MLIICWELCILMRSELQLNSGTRSEQYLSLVTLVSRMSGRIGKFGNMLKKHTGPDIHSRSQIPSCTTNSRVAPWGPAHMSSAWQCDGHSSGALYKASAQWCTHSARPAQSHGNPQAVRLPVWFWAHELWIVRVVWTWIWSGKRWKP